MRFALTTLLLGASLAAQVSTPAFDSASVRAAGPDSGRMNIKTDPGGVTLTNVGLDQAVEWAWQIEPLQLSGPDWLGDARFDIAGRTAGPADPAQLRLMLRSLLAQRFALRAHNETRQAADYAIEIGKNGPRFHAPTARDPSQFEVSADTGEAVFTREGTVLIAAHATLADLAATLSTALNRPIVDRTGLSGHYDIRIDAGAFTTAAPGGAADPNGGRIDPIAAIFNAFQPQLGLRVEPGKDPIDFLVIDGIAKTPTRN